MSVFDSLRDIVRFRHYCTVCFDLHGLGLFRTPHCLGCSCLPGAPAIFQVPEFHV